MSTRKRKKRNRLTRALNRGLVAFLEGVIALWKRPIGRASLILILALVLFGCGAGIYFSLREPSVQVAVPVPEEDEVLDLPDPTPTLPVKEPEEPVDDDTPRPDPESKQGVDFDGLREKLKEAKEVNGEAVAWLYVPGTTISHPVFHTTDNSFYLDHNATKAYDPYGAPYIDYRNTVGLRSSDFSVNTIIYAHNKADHLLFGQLLDTYLDADSARDSCYVYLVTEGEVMIYKVFAGFYTNGSNEGEKIFNYRQLSPEGDALTKLVADAKERSWVKYNVDVEEGDQLITLSTCGYRYRYASTGGYIDVTRFGVMARRLRDGETDGDPVILYNNHSPLEPTFRNAFYASDYAR